MWCIAMSQRLEAAIIGCGQVAGGYASAGSDVFTHAAAYRSHPDFRLVACVESNPARRAAFAQRWEVEHAYATVEELLDRHPHLAVVSLCTPTASHAEGLRTLLPSRVPAVFCEKPIAGSLEDAETLVDAYESAGKILAVNHTRRFDPAVRGLQRRIAYGELGAIRAVAGTYTGGVVNNGTHWIDLASMLLGELALDHVVHARIDRDPGDPTVDAVLKGHGDTPVHLVGADARDYAMFELRLITEKGVLDLEERGFVLRERHPEPDARFPGFWRLGEPVSEETRLNESFRFALDAIRDALGGQPPPSTGRTALAAQRLCEAMRREGLRYLESHP
jgi:predicted dehydrogenase